MFRRMHHSVQKLSLALLEYESWNTGLIVSDFGGNPGVIRTDKTDISFRNKKIQALAVNREVLLTDQKLYDYMSQGAKKIFKRLLRFERR